MNYFIYFCLWNICVFLIYGLDKFLSKTNYRRISEKMLISIAFLFGALGASAGMIIFRHKTKKQKFKILIPMAIISNIILLGYRNVFLF